MADAEETPLFEDSAGGDPDVVAPVAPATADAPASPTDAESAPDADPKPLTQVEVVSATSETAPLNVNQASDAPASPATEPATPSEEGASTDPAAAATPATASREKFEKQILNEEEKQAFNSCMSLLFYLFFLFVFFFQSYFSRGNEDAYYMGERIKQDIIENEFLTGADTPNSFYSIANFDDMWRFLEGDDSPLRGALLLQQGTDGEIFPQLDEYDQYWPQGANFLMGKIRIRQVRVKADSCDIPEEVEDVIKQCYARFTLDDEETEPFGEGDKYQHMTEEETQEGSWWGKLGFYPGSGYVVDVDLNETKYKETLAELRADDFIVPGITRAVFVDFQMYNPAINIHFTARCAFETPHTGGIRTKADFFGVKLNAYSGATGLAQGICEIFLALFVIAFIILEVRSMRKLGCKEYWNLLVSWVNWANIILVTVNLMMSLSILSGAFLDWSDPIMKWDTEFVPMVDFMVVLQISNLAASVNALVLWIKLLLYLNINPRMAVIFTTISYAATDLGYFAILFSIFTIAWGHSGYLAFAGDVYTFRSISQSIMNVFLGVFGGLDGDGLEAASLYYGPTFEFFFQICMLLILLNVFLAIMNDAYSLVQQKTKDTPSASKTRAYKSLCVKLWANCRRKSPHNSFEAIDKDNDMKLSREELVRRYISAKGLAKEKAEIAADNLLAKLDIDGDQALSVEESKLLDIKTMSPIELSPEEQQKLELKNLIVSLRKTITTLKGKVKENREELKRLTSKVGSDLPGSS